MSNETFVKNLKRLRRENGYTCTRLSNLLGLNNDFIASLEREKRMSNSKNLKKIADFFGITIDELCGGELSHQNIPKKESVKVAKNSFAENLKALRQEINFSQAALADLIGWTGQTIKNYEEEKTLPFIDNLIKLAEFFDVSVDELIRGDFCDKNILETRTLRNKKNFSAENSFAENLKNLREKNHYSQAEISDFLGIHFTAASRYEIGRTEPRLDRLIDFADFFAVTVDELVCFNVAS